MKTRRILLLAVCGLCLAGCKSGKQNQELLERELRCQEDHIYELEDALDQCECELESVRRENQTLKKEGGGGGDQGPGSPSSLPVIDIPSDSGSAHPKRRGRQDEPTPPVVEPGEEFTPTPSTLDSSALPEPADRHIARIVLNKQLTGGVNHNRGGGDGGILVVFEPRNARGEMVAEPGDVSIALVDPNRSGPQARIARWDFAASEAFQQFHRSGALGRGYEFELPWPDAAPQNKKLELFVRYVAPDGRKLMSEMTISVNPPEGNQAKSWRTAPGRPDAGMPRNATVQNVPARRRMIGAGSDGGSRNTEAPRFSATDSSTEGSGSTTPPTIDLGDEDAGPAEAENPRAAADDESPAAVARRPANSRQSDRPTWTPYR